MFSFSRSKFIQVPPEFLFDFATDQINLPKWSPEVIRSDVIGGGPVQRGARLKQERRRGKGSFSTELTVVEHERPSRHSLTALVLGFYATFRFSFAAEGEGTRAQFDARIVGKGLVNRLFEAFIGRTIERTDDRVLERLKAAAETAYSKSSKRSKR